MRNSMLMLPFLGLFFVVCQPASLVSAASDSCRQIRNAAAHSNGAERVRMLQVLTLRDGNKVQREWRMLGDRRYTKHGEGPWIEDQRPDDWMQAFEGHISNCKRIGLDSINGIAATVWTYSRDMEGARRSTKMWLEERSNRVLRTEIDFGSGSVQYRRSISQFDYALDIDRPKGAIAK